MIFFYIKKDLSRNIPINENQTALLEVVELLQIVEENTQTKAQETLDFKLNKPYQNSTSDDPSLYPEKWVMGWQIHKFLKLLTI